MKVFAGVIVLLCVACGAIGLSLWRTGDEEVTYRVVPLTRGDLMITVSASGTIEPEEIVDVGAQVVGRIKNFGVDPNAPDETVDYGTFVEEGTVLAQIDETTYKALVDIAEADVKRAQAEMARFEAMLSRAKADWERASELEDSIPRSEYDRLAAEYEMAKADLQIGDAGILQAEAQLRQAQANLEFTTIKSPIRGIVLDRRVNVGQTVVSGLNAPSLFLLAKDLKRLEIWASINEADISSIRRGQSVRFTVDAYPDMTFDGEVSQIRLNASMTQNVVTYTVIVTTSNSDDQLKPYMTANLHAEVARRENVLLVPTQALHWRPSPELIVPEAREDAAALYSTPATESPLGEAASGGKGKSGTLWVEAGGGLVRPVAVRVGLSDGVTSEIVQTDCKPGERIVVARVYHNEEEADFLSTFVDLGKK